LKQKYFLLIKKAINAGVEVVNLEVVGTDVAIIFFAIFADFLRKKIAFFLKTTILFSEAGS
jgi:hypothetical protein